MAPSKLKGQDGTYGIVIPGLWPAIELPRKLLLLFLVTLTTATAKMSSPKTGIKVIIVGAGFGGLTAAIECHRQGHDVEIYESFPELKVLGDIISFGSNAGRIFHRWSDGEVVSRLLPLCIDIKDYGFRIRKYDTGEVVYHQKRKPPSPEAPVLNGHRGELHQVIFNYARDELKIPIHLGQRVSEYFETESGAGIVLNSGEKVSSLMVAYELPLY